MFTSSDVIGCSCFWSFHAFSHVEHHPVVIANISDHFLLVYERNTLFVLIIFFVIDGRLLGRQVAVTTYLKLKEREIIIVCSKTNERFNCLFEYH